MAAVLLPVAQTKTDHPDPYMHALYGLRFSGKQTLEGTGELWLWFGPGRPSLRIEGTLHNDGGDGSEHLALVLATDGALYYSGGGAKLHQRHCLRFKSLANSSFHDFDKRLEKLSKRTELIEQTGRQDQNDADATWFTTRITLNPVNASEEYAMDWSAGSTLKEVQSMRMRLGEYTIKEVTLKGPPNWASYVPKDQKKLLASLEGCEDFGEYPYPDSRVGAPFAKSWALHDLLLLIAASIDPHAASPSRETVRLAAIAVLGDLVALTTGPTPPQVGSMMNIGFNYASTVYAWGGESMLPEACNGSAWFNFGERALRIRDEEWETSQGPAMLDFLAMATLDEDGALFASANLTAQGKQQCLRMPYPEDNRSVAAGLEGLASSSGALAFERLEAWGDLDCGVFSAPLARGRRLRMWVSMLGDTSAVQSIVRTEVVRLPRDGGKEPGKGEQVLRQNDIKLWHDGEDDLAKWKQFSKSWKCADEKGINGPALASFGLQGIHAWSETLREALYSLRNLPPEGMFLEALALAGDVNWEVALPEPPRLDTNGAFAFSAYLGLIDIDDPEDTDAAMVVHGTLEASPDSQQVHLNLSTDLMDGLQIALAFDDGLLAVGLQEVEGSWRCLTLPLQSLDKESGAESRTDAVSIFDGIEVMGIKGVEGTRECNKFRFLRCSKAPQDQDFDKASAESRSCTETRLWFAPTEKEVCMLEAASPQAASSSVAGFVAIHPELDAARSTRQPASQGIPSDWDCTPAADESRPWLLLVPEGLPEAQRTADEFAHPVAALLPSMLETFATVGFITQFSADALSRMRLDLGPEDTRNQQPIQDCSSYDGIRGSRNKCCAAACGTDAHSCGGPDCSQKPAGASMCCEDGIPDTRVCGPSQKAPCTLGVSTSKTLVNEDSFLYATYHLSVTKDTVSGEGSIRLAVAGGVSRLKISGRASNAGKGKRFIMVADAASDIAHVMLGESSDRGGQCISWKLPEMDEYLESRAAELKQRTEQVTQLYEEAVKAGDADGKWLTVDLKRPYAVDFTVGSDGVMKKVHLRRGDVIIKTLNLTQKAHVSDGPPKRYATAESGVGFNPPVESCKEVIELENPLAFKGDRKLHLTPPWERSWAVMDLMLLMKAGKSQGAQLVLTLFALLALADVRTVTDGPKPPVMLGNKVFGFRYSATIYTWGGQLMDKPEYSNGTVRVNFGEHVLWIRDEEKETKLGTVSLEVLARARRDSKFYSYVELPAQGEQQCVLYGYPGLPANRPSEEEQLEAGSQEEVTFAYLQQLKRDDFPEGVDCAVFTAPLARGRQLRLWVDLDGDNLSSVLRSEVYQFVTGGDQILRKTDILEWLSEDEGPLTEIEAEFKVQKNCTSQPNQLGRLAQLGLDEGGKWSMMLKDALYSLEHLEPRFATLEVLGLAGDVNFEVTKWPEPPRFEQVAEVVFNFSVYLGSSEGMQDNLVDDPETQTVGSFSVDFRRGTTFLAMTAQGSKGTADLMLMLSQGALAVRVQEAEGESPRCLKLPVDAAALSGDDSSTSARDVVGDFRGVESVGAEKDCNLFQFRPPCDFGACGVVKLWHSSKTRKICGLETLARGEGEGVVGARLYLVDFEQCTDLPGSRSQAAWKDGVNGCEAYASNSSWCDLHGQTDFNGEGSAADKCCACGGGVAPRSGRAASAGRQLLEDSSCEMVDSVAAPWLSLDRLAPPPPGPEAQPVIGALASVVQAAEALRLLPPQAQLVLSRLLVTLPLPEVVATTSTTTTSPVDIFSDDLKAFSFRFASEYTERSPKASGGTPNRPHLGPRTDSMGYVHVDIENRQLRVLGSGQVSQGLPVLESEIIVKEEKDRVQFWARTAVPPPEPYQECWHAEAPLASGSSRPVNPFARSVSVLGMKPAKELGDRFELNLSPLEQVRFSVENRSRLLSVLLEDRTSGHDVVVTVSKWSTATLDNSIFEPSSLGCDGLNELPGHEAIFKRLERWALLKVFLPFEEVRQLEDSALHLHTT